MLLCSGRGKTAVLGGVGLPHKEQHRYNLQDGVDLGKVNAHSGTSQLRYDLNQDAGTD